ncbi:putative chromosome segregation ATPase [Planoprotostelium fungivorum]|uniref:Putative chromosome segregation ATPase n=1 Tax=Planoprotostelium fungivorum TaxID=1890364 RepID=A0A2P6N4I7_9EUKA|nr:putative chromosome segregation ATPase [Planoprotostelium fungivorum]
MATLDIRSRRERLKQVREQEALVALKLREQYKERKKEVSTKLYEREEHSWQAQQQKKRHDVEQKLQVVMSELGQADRQADQKRLQQRQQNMTTQFQQREALSRQNERSQTAKHHLHFKDPDEERRQNQILQNLESLEQQRKDLLRREKVKKIRLGLTTSRGGVQLRSPPCHRSPPASPTKGQRRSVISPDAFSMATNERTKRDLMQREGVEKKLNDREKVESRYVKATDFVKQKRQEKSLKLTEHQSQREKETMDKQQERRQRFDQYNTETDAILVEQLLSRRPTNATNSPLDEASDPEDIFYKVDRRRHSEPIDRNHYPNDHRRHSGDVRVELDDLLMEFESRMDAHLSRQRESLNRSMEVYVQHVQPEAFGEFNDRGTLHLVQTGGNSFASPISYYGKTMSPFDSPFDGDE